MISEDCLNVRLGEYLDDRREPDPVVADDSTDGDENASPVEDDANRG